MNIKRFFDIDTPEEAEKVIRSASFPVDCEALSHVAELYFNAGNDYKALTLIIDFFRNAKLLYGFLTI